MGVVARFQSKCESLRSVAMHVGLAGIGLLLSCVICCGTSRAADEPEQKLTNRARVPGTLNLLQRTREESSDGSKTYVVSESVVDWEVAETAIIVCDMWDDHWCKLAAQRVGVLAPKMNAVLTAARSHGVMVIHAPSDTLEFYAKTPQRVRMQMAPRAMPPVPIQRWCKLMPDKEPPLPIDDSQGGCDDPEPVKSFKAWTRQHAAIDVTGFDGVTDSGEEVYNFCVQEGIKNLVVMGVHTNMCVLGRSFGIRQMKQLGLNVVLARDLTDAMYDPRQKPRVSHARGTDLVIEHIETWWCPSIRGEDLTHVVYGSADAKE